MDTAREVSKSDNPVDSEPPVDPNRRSRPAPRGTAAYQRKRAVKACQVCRARRTKCDNLKPSCSFCLKVGATCIQSPEDLSSFDPASLKILERLDNLEQLMKSLSTGEDEPARKTRAVSSATSNAVECDYVIRVDVDMILPPSSERVLSWHILRAIGADKPEVVGDTRADGPAHQLQMPYPPSLLGALPEDPRQVQILLDNFFNYVHVKNPILDEPSTRKMILSKVLDGLGFDWSPESCLSLLVCALGAISTPFGPSTETMPGTAAYSDAQTFFEAAQKRLGMLLASNDIIAAQCLFLSGVFMMCIFQPAKAWRYFVQAVAGCQHFAFLSPRKDLDEPGEMAIDHHTSEGPDVTDTLHQAIYWSSWKSEREVRGDLRRPDFPVSDQDTRLYPPFFPTPPAPRADVSRPAMDAGQAREQISWYFYLAEISLRRLCARLSAEMLAMKETHPSRPAFLTAMASLLSSYEAQAAEWEASLPPCLTLKAPADDDICRFVLRGHLIDLYEVIYWPFLSAFLNDGRPDGVSTSKFADQAQKGLNHHIIRLRVNKPGYRHRHHGTNPLMRSCSRSALVLLAASRSNRISEALGLISLALPYGWQGEVEELIQLLEFWGSETNEYNEIRRVLQRGLGENHNPI